MTPEKLKTANEISEEIKRLEERIGILKAATSIVNCYLTVGSAYVHFETRELDMIREMLIALTRQRLDARRDEFQAL